MNGEDGPPCLRCTPPTKAASKNVDVRLGSYQNINAEYTAVGKSSKISQSFVLPASVHELCTRADTAKKQVQ